VVSSFELEMMDRLVARFRPLHIEIQLHIQEVLGSNRGQQAGYHYWLYRGVFQFFHAKPRQYLKIRYRNFLSKSSFIMFI
jgi:hypothetical protein